MPHVVRDTSDLSKRLDGLTIPPDTLLVTIDVQALYSSIPHELGIQTVKKFLMEQDHRQW